MSWISSPGVSSILALHLSQRAFDHPRRCKYPPYAPCIHSTYHNAASILCFLSPFPLFITFSRWSRYARVASASLDGILKATPHVTSSWPCYTWMLDNNAYVSFSNNITTSSIVFHSSTGIRVTTRPGFSGVPRWSSLCCKQMSPIYTLSCLACHTCQNRRT